MILKNLRERLSSAYHEGKMHKALDYCFLLMNGSLVHIPFVVQEKEESVRETTDLAKEEREKMVQRTNNYGFLERIAYSQGYKRG